MDFAATAMAIAQWCHVDIPQSQFKKEAALVECSSAAIYSKNCSRCYSSTLSSPPPFQLIRALGAAADFAVTAMAMAQWCHVDIPQSQFQKWPASFPPAAICVRNFCIAAAHSPYLLIFPSNSVRVWGPAQIVSQLPWRSSDPHHNSENGHRRQP